jgi:hypothetical protein
MPKKFLYYGVFYVIVIAVEGNKERKPAAQVSSRIPAA